MTIPQQFTERKVPASAFRSTIEVQFAAADKRTDKTIPITLFARSNKPVENYYWGGIYHDFATMKHKPTIPLDYCHNDWELVGAGNKFDVKDDGLHVDGHLVSSRPRVQEIMELADAGVPFEASIDFRGDAEYHEVAKGHSAEVNGQTVQGPALIIRNWTLRAVAICPHGRDPNTSSQFSKDNDQEVMVRIFQAGEPMTTPQTKTPDTGNTVEQQQTVTPNKPTEPVAPVADQAQFKADLQKFTDRFGAERGAKWFLEGKTFSEAVELENAELKQQLSAAGEKNKELTDKLSSVHTGEETPASFTQDPKDAPKGGAVENRFAHMGKIGGFASAMKIPGK